MPHACAQVLTITTPRPAEDPTAGLASSAALAEGAGGGGVREKPCVVLCGRVHPGETNSSWMVKGAVDFLVSTAPEAQTLRDRFAFKILPVHPLALARRDHHPPPNPNLMATLSPPMFSLCVPSQLSSKLLILTVVLQCPA
jgi:hypothetical protein